MASNVILKPNGSGGWDDYMKIPMADTLTTHSGRLRQDRQRAVPDRQPRPQYRRLTVDRPRIRQANQRLAENPKADVAGVISHPTEKTIQAVHSITPPRSGRFSIRRSSPTLTIWPQ